MKEADLQKQKAYIEEQEKVASAKTFTKKAELEAEFELLNYKKEAAAATAEADALEYDQNVCGSKKSDLLSKTVYERTNRYVEQQFQDISVVITSEHPIQELEILEDEQELSSMNVSCFVDVQEWELKDFVVTEAKQMTKEFSETKNISFPLLTVKTLAVRQFGFFVWNILIIMTIISLLSFTTFAVDNTKPQNRLQLGFTLTLTGVTFRFVTNQSLPKISYLTKLDVYILFCMLFNFCISIWHAVITRFNDNSDQDSMDYWAFIIFIIIYSVFQLIYFMIVVGSVSINYLIIYTL
ncbi:uncharacterized protein LOC127721109 [Mytilus californianus]|uniref:uncharacterized protein LOC127721109 n=1 Tax=Mytilus californianus TaxID=6549 RepID=UPI00224618B3|nr:uncharacterized protein LOC127721109 [Mytilus californianus]